ncbi:glycosyltransferase family 4 protein [Vibrio breoganii]
MKILVCASYKHAWNSIRPEAEIFVELARLGHKITVFTQHDAEYVDRLRSSGIEVIGCYPNRKICWSTIKAYRNELKSGDYDICYAFNSRTIPNAAFACVGLRVKLIAYRGTTGGLYRHDPSAYLTQLSPRVDGIVCVSEAVRRDVVTKVWKNKANVVTIYKGHDVSWYQVKPTPRAEFGLNKDDIVIFCAAHVRPSKGINVLIESSNYFDSPNVHIVFAGSGFEPYFEQIRQSKMSERIHYIGHRKDIPSLMAMADIQVQPSISGEGLPRTIIEAMANGTTSVVTTTGGSPELVEDGETGFIVPVSDPAAMAEAINKMAAEPAAIKKMGAAARLRLQTKFSSSVTVSQHLEFFRRILN